MGKEEALLLPTDTPADKAAEKRLYRELARRFHPDLGQTAIEIAYRTEMMAAVNQAYAAADTLALYDLVDELEPATISGLRRLSGRDLRALNEQLLRLRQRRRKVARRLSALRGDNTARMWQRARLLDRSDADWWEAVRADIERALGQLQAEIMQLEAADFDD
jgi:hypothetical protein